MQEGCDWGNCPNPAVYVMKDERDQDINASVYFCQTHTDMARAVPPESDQPHGPYLLWARVGEME